MCWTISTTNLFRSGCGGRSRCCARNFRFTKHNDTETQRGPEQSKMIPGQTTKLKDEFRCLSHDCSGPLCVFVFTASVILSVSGSRASCSTPQRPFGSPREFHLLERNGCSL